MLWSGASRGANSLIPLFSMDRPFMGVIYSYFYRFLTDHILGWHAFALLVRIAGAAAFYWVLTLVWPKLKNLFVLSAMLFVIFPGFMAEPNAATKVNHLIGYGAALFSIAFTLKAAKTTRPAWKYASIFLSLIFMALYVWIYEYMVGLEVMRVVLLYWVQRQGEPLPLVASAKKMARAYIPYALVGVMFVVWRVLIYHSTRPATDLKGLALDYLTNPFGMALRLVFQTVKDFFTATTFAWFVQPYNLLAQAPYAEILTAIVIALLVILLAVGYVRFVRRPAETADSEDGTPVVLVWTGALITLGAIFPVVFLNRWIDLMDPYKGYALHPSAGVIILVTGLVALLRPRYRTVALIALIGFSVVAQTMNSQRWARFWDIERGMWWQLSWRAPNIQDNTLVMAYLPFGYAYQQDYEVWAPINLIYHPEFEPAPLIQSEVLNQDTVLFVMNGILNDTTVRDIPMRRDYANYLLISQPSASSCIHVIDGKMPAYSTSERPLVEQVGGYSNLSRIDPSAAPHVPPPDIFGPPPEPTWCYYFQKASLARQLGDWAQIAQLYDAASSAKLSAGDPSEYFVFIEGLVNQGRAPDAQAVVNAEVKDNPALVHSLCQSLSADPGYPASFGYHQDQIKQLICSNQEGTP